MSLHDRLFQLVTALPSPTSAVTFTRADLVALLRDDSGEAVVAGSMPDLTAEEVGAEIGRAPSTIRGFLIDGKLRGYKLNGRDWRIPRSALRSYLDAQWAEVSNPPGEVDISAWRKFGMEQ